jgi:hypothetical protein
MPGRTREQLIDLAGQATVRLTGGTDPVVTTLRQDASNRSYHRVAVARGTPSTLVVMELGDPRPEETTKGSTPVDLPFLDVQRYLAAGEILVPRVYHHDVAEGLVFLEDLGDVTLESVVAGAEPTRRMPLYRLAVEQLGRMQRYAAGHATGSVAFGRRFDGDLLRWELDHFREWLLEAQRGLVLGGAERSTLEGAFDRIASELAKLPTVFVHRDYQSRNLMIQYVNSDIVLRVIDFQDALVGPLPYDLVALLRDSYVALTTPEVDDLIDHYWERHGAHLASDLTAEAFRRAFHLQTVQRKLKDAGRFVFIERKKGNPSFLPFVSPSLRYVARALESLPDLVDLRALLRRLPEFDPPPSPTGDR